MCQCKTSKFCTWLCIPTTTVQEKATFRWPIHSQSVPRQLQISHLFSSCRFGTNQQSIVWKHGYLKYCLRYILQFQDQRLQNGIKQFKVLAQNVSSGVNELENVVIIKMKRSRNCYLELNNDIQWIDVLQYAWHAIAEMEYCVSHCENYMLNFRWIT